MHLGDRFRVVGSRMSDGEGCRDHGGMLGRRTPIPQVLESVKGDKNCQPRKTDPRATARRARDSIAIRQIYRAPTPRSSKTPMIARYATKGHAENRSRMRIRLQIAAKAEIEATTRPSARIDQPWTSRCALTNLY